MEDQFDRLSKALARTTSRREALRVAGLGAGALFASLGLPTSIWARGECRRLCTGLFSGRGEGRARLQCIRDCDGCRTACPEFDDLCIADCIGDCRQQCIQKGFPAGRRPGASAAWRGWGPRQPSGPRGPIPARYRINARAMMFRWISLVPE